MYTIQHTVFGDYRDVKWTDSLEKAIEMAHNIYEYGGWLNVRVVHPNGAITQVHGE
jgi:hypothetical protein